MKSSKNYSRRDFVKMMVIGGLSVPALLSSLTRELKAESLINRQPLIWIQGHTSGIQQAGVWGEPDFDKLVKEFFQLLSWNQLDPNFDQRKIKPQSEKSILILEGLFNKNSDFSYGIELIKKYSNQAKAIILLGNEACHNQFGNKKHLNLVQTLSKNKQSPLIFLPGAPTPFRHLLGTLNHLYLYGIPELDEHRRPLMFYSKVICDNCEFRKDFESGNFVNYFGEKQGCLYLLGCKGRITQNSCPIEHWNGSSNWCVKAGMPCSGCSNPNYPDHQGLGIFGELSSEHMASQAGWIKYTRKITTGLLGLTAAGIGIHAFTKKENESFDADQLLPDFEIEEEKEEEFK